MKMLNLEKAIEQTTERIYSDRNEKDKIYIHVSDFAGEAIRQHAKALIAYRDMLERLEKWLMDTIRCPICHEIKRDGHAKDCELAKLLGKSEGQK